MQKKTHIKNVLSLIVCIVLIAAMALFTTACNGNKDTDNSSSIGSISKIESTVLGVGEKQFTFTVTDLEGATKNFTINTNKATVGDALLELELIAGEEGPYGLYVKTVNGVTVDYDKDGKYWAFYMNGEYASSGVDTTEITEGATYSFKAE